MITGYTLSCPCAGRVIEGSLIKVHGEASGIEAGSFVECPCGCLHRVQLVDTDARLIGLARLTIDEQIATHRKLGRDMVRLGCPSCDNQHLTDVPDGFDPTLGFVFACPDCRAAFTITERRGDELITRALTEDEAARSVFGAFGGNSNGNATGSTPFGSDPFGTFGGSS